MRFAYFLILSLSVFSMAGQRVKSSSYDLLLQGLLSHSVDEVSVAELKEMPQAQLIDSREAEEYNVSHIKGATFVGYDNFSTSASKKPG